MLDNFPLPEGSRMDTFNQISKIRQICRVSKKVPWPLWILITYEFRVALQNQIHTWKLETCTIFLKKNMILGLVLLQIFNSYTNLVDWSPKSHVLLIYMSWQMEACFITKPNIVYKWWFMFYLVTYQITKSDSRLLSATLMFCFICTVLSLINAPGALQFFKRGMFIRRKFSMQKCSV